MSHRSQAAAVAAVAGVALLPAFAAARTADAAGPRTPWGHPDLQGTWDSAEERKTGKMRTLFTVVLFVLVLFGSVVPASAQGAQGYGVIIQSVIVSVSAALGALFTLLTFWWKFDDKIGKLGEKIDTTTRETNGKIDRTNERIDAAKKDLKEDAQKAHTEIGTNIRTVGDDVRTSEKRVTDNFNARFDDLRDYLKLALHQIDKDRP